VSECKVDARATRLISPTTPAEFRQRISVEYCLCYIGPAHVSLNEGDGLA
jgi:hypothetical protein